MNHPPTVATNLRLVPSDDEPRSRDFRDQAVDGGPALKSGLSAIVPSWLLSLVLHAGLFALLAVSLPGLRGGIVGDPDGDLRSVGIWVGHPGDGSDGDGSGTGSAKAAAGETNLVPSIKSDPFAETVVSTSPPSTTIPDLSPPVVRPEAGLPVDLSPRPLNPAVPNPVAASPILGPGPRPERRGLYQPSAEPPSPAAAKLAAATQAAEAVPAGRGGRPRFSASSTSAAASFT